MPAKANIRIDADDARATAAWRRQLGNLDNAAAKVKLVAAAAVASAAAIGAFTVRVVKNADELGKAAKVADVNVESLQELRFALGQLAGTTDRDVDLSLQRFNRRLGLARAGSREYAAELERLNVSLNLGTEPALQQTLAALSQVENDADRAASASKLFGEEAGPRLAAALRTGLAPLQELRSTLRDQGGIISQENIARAEEANDAFDLLKKTVDANLSNALLENADALTTLAEAFGRIIDVAGSAVEHLKGFAEFIGARVTGTDLAPLIADVVEAEESLEHARGTLFEDFFAAKLKNAQQELAKAERIVEAIFQREREIIATLNAQASIDATSQVTASTAPSQAQEEALQAELAKIVEFNDKIIEKRREREERQLELARDGRERFFELVDEETEVLLEKRRFRNEQIAEIDAASREEELQREEEFQASLASLRNAGFGQLATIISEGRKFEEKSAADKAHFVLGTAAQLTAGLAQNNKKIFKLNQALAIADAIVATARAVTQALPNFPLAALVAAAGAIQIATIASTQFGGGGRGAVTSGPSTGVPSQARSQVPAAPVITERGQNAASNITLRIESDSSELGRALANSIRVMVDSDEVFIDRNSRQAAEIRAQ